MRETFLGIRGGGVKSAVGIGVIKYLEENNIQIKAISGTSIGSVIAALYVCGKTPEQMVERLRKYTIWYGNETLIKGGSCNSAVIEQTVNEECQYRTFAEVDIPIYIPSNIGGLWNTKLFVFSKETTPDITLGEACRASSGFPILYKRYQLNVNGEKLKFFDGGMVANPFVPTECEYPIIVSSFQKEKTNTRSRYVDAWKVAENNADFCIKPFIGDMGTIGIPADINISSKLGYYEAKRILH